MNYILFDDVNRNNLLPLCYTKPIADLRIGILTIREKWERYLKEGTSSLTEDYLSFKYPIVRKEDNILINGSVCPNDELLAQVKKLKPKQALVKDENIIALHVCDNELEKVGDTTREGIENIEISIDFIEVNNTWDLFSKNNQAIQDDFLLVTKGRKSQELSQSNTIIGDGDIFVEKGAKVEASIINTENGPVYIGEGAEVMEGCIIRGPFALCEHAVIKMGAKIYGPTTIGPYCKVGGEVNNSMFIGYANKAHDGFIGNSVIGEWCNLGADTNNSNLKNTYDIVRLWSYFQGTFVNTGLQFCGLIMGDHSKCGINTMFNTGTMIGISCNLFGAGFHRNFVPSFSWGGPAGYSIYNPKKALDVAELVYERRGLDFDDIERDILKAVFDLTHKNRRI